MTLLLSALGAAVGAAVGTLSLLGVYVAVRGWRHDGVLTEPLALAAAFGALLGLVLAPIAAWTLMRHVPLWRAIAETALGTLIGYAVGWFFPLVLKGMPAAPLICALLGFTVAAIRLRLTRRRVAGGG